MFFDVSQGLLVRRNQIWPQAEIVKREERIAWILCLWYGCATSGVYDLDRALAAGGSSGSEQPVIITTAQLFLISPPVSITSPHPLFYVLVHTRILLLGGYQNHCI